jgi:hypothetical protein
MQHPNIDIYFVFFFALHMHIKCLKFHKKGYYDLQEDGSSDRGWIFESMH